ncbi:hypothetical protein F6J58_09280 [Clostridium perfringens]|uniref:lipopolysaccharide biosynthesis protein n=3 Tax=Clostridium perfringens TaxID=1502 RepID=UPI0013E3D147|nr:hypothetical protein [Clostridium perfringens]EJT6614079.1 hypothetical protein [Clostridium perfringens]MCX0400851.1 hypothetical protein [Clostridium perfringens]MDM0867866.1 hypothetical protein [Clostridium perfringens]NGT84728.1 hypothetical protein [Clostridium perfringens]HAT4349624.1 hypothetical protein [Clostridium perfringens]
MKNMKINLVFYFIIIILNFVSKSIFIKYLGATINGVNSLLTSLISFLNVAELGVGAAVGYSLYKPLNDNQWNEVENIMILFKYYYKKIAIIISVLGIILSIILPFLIKGQINLLSAYIYYFIYLLNCVLSYFFTYKQTLIIADQKQYKIAFELNITKIIKIIAQCILLVIFKNFIIWLITEVLFNILGMYLANKKIDKEYKNLLTWSSDEEIDEIKTENKLIGKNIGDIFFHKIGTFVVKQTDAIVISIFSTLVETGIYANYLLIINSLSGLVANTIGSVMPSIGNLIADESREKSYKIFKRLYLLDNLIALFLSVCLYFVIDKFILWWVGQEYIFSKYCVIALILNFYIEISRGTIDRFKSGFGIFWDRMAPVFESLVNLFMSVFLAYKLGIVGVFIGTIISNFLIIQIWKPYIVFKEGFQMSIFKYINQTVSIYLRNIIIVIICNFIMKFIDAKFVGFNSFINLFLSGISIFLVCCISIISVYSFDKEFRNLIKVIILKLKR